MIPHVLLLAAFLLFMCQYIRALPVYRTHSSYRFHIDTYLISSKLSIYFILLMSFVFNNNVSALMGVVFVVYLIQLCVYMKKRYFSLSSNTIWIQMLVGSSYGASAALAFVRALTITNKKTETTLSVLLPTLTVIWVLCHTCLKDAQTVTNVDFNVRYIFNKKKQKKGVIIDYGLTRN